MQDVRQGKVIRETKETRISLELKLDGGKSRDINTGIGFFDHMLDAMTAHGFMDIALDCAGDLRVDAHHTIEDVGICFGQALAQCFGDKRGIARYASCHIPMDEALAFVSLDLCGRTYLHYDVPPIESGTFVGAMDAQLIEEFFRAIAQHAGMTLHISLIHGRNIHHILEAICKAFGNALSLALQANPRRAGEIPSTKGTI